MGAFRRRQRCDSPDGTVGSTRFAVASKMCRVRDGGEDQLSAVAMAARRSPMYWVRESSMKSALG